MLLICIIIRLVTCQIRAFAYNPSGVRDIIKRAEAIMKMEENLG